MDQTTTPDRSTIRSLIGSSSEAWANPHPHYHRLRAEAPVHYVPELDEYVLTRFDDCERVLRDPTMSSDATRRNVQLRNGARQAAGDGRVPSMLFMDPPDHTRLRKLVSKAFTPRTVERLRPHVAELVDGLLDQVDPAGFDLIESLGYPLPVTVICELLGIPTQDQGMFGPWSSAVSRMLDADLDEATIQAGVVAFVELMSYLDGILEERRANPRDDLLSGLIAAEEAGDRLTEEELRSTVLLLFVAGHETTTNLIGNGITALLRHRDQWERLVADPSLAPGAVEEVLRFDGPVHLTGRTATVECEVAGVTVTPGQGLLTLIAAANRDPARFPDPDRLDITRPNPHHLAFSHGIHYCLGAALARLEGQEAFKALATRFPHLELAEEPVHREHFVLRGYQAVHLRA
ncbi:MAG TPA: cytochrome P450 [Acidimicrobiales bacterium]|nr:cytochrome P450 [Acidimicrobiales bacterium]